MDSRNEKGNTEPDKSTAKSGQESIEKEINNELKTNDANQSLVKKPNESSQQSPPSK